MTPEERAFAILRKRYEAAFSLTDDKWPKMEVEIAAAIRAAENDAIEKCAKLAMDNQMVEVDAYGQGYNDACRRIAFLIERAIKSHGDTAP